MLSMLSLRHSSLRVPGMEATGGLPGPSFRVLVRDSTLDSGQCIVKRSGVLHAFDSNLVPSVGGGPVEATLADAEDGSSVRIKLVAWSAGHCRVEGLRPWLQRRGVCIGQKLQVERSADGKTLLRVLHDTAAATATAAAAPAAAAAAAAPAAGQSDAHHTARGGGGPASRGAPPAAAATAGGDTVPVAGDRSVALPLQQQHHQCNPRASLGQGNADQGRQDSRPCGEREQQQQQQGHQKALDQGGAPTAQPRSDLPPKSPAVAPANIPNERRGCTPAQREGAASRALQQAPQQQLQQQRQQQEQLRGTGVGDGGGGGGRLGASGAKGAGRDVKTTQAGKGRARDAGPAVPLNAPGWQQAGEGAACHHSRAMPGAGPQTELHAKGRGRPASQSERDGTGGVAAGVKGPKEQLGAGAHRPSPHRHPADVDASVPAPPTKRLRQERAVGDHGKGHVPGPAQVRQAQGRGEGGAQGQGRRGEVQGPGRAEGKAEAPARRTGLSAVRRTLEARVDAPAPLEDLPLAKRRRLLQTRGREGAGASGEGGRRGGCSQEESAISQLAGKRNTCHASGTSPTPPPPLASAPDFRAAAHPDAVPGSAAPRRQQQQQQHQRPSSAPPSPPSPPRPRQVPTPPPSPPSPALPRPQPPPPPPKQQQLPGGAGHVVRGSGAKGSRGRGATTPVRGAAPAPATAPATAPAGPPPAAPAPAAADAEASPVVTCVLAKYRHTQHELRLPLIAQPWFPSPDDGRQTVSVYGRASRDSDGGRPEQLKAFPISLALQRGGWQKDKDGDLSKQRRRLVMSNTSKLVRWVGLGPTGQVWLRQQELAAGELGQQRGPGKGTGAKVVVVMERA